MKLAITDLQSKKQGEKQLPVQFVEEYRPDLIRRAVRALQAAARQVFGASTEAGFRHSSRLSKRRRDYRGCYGFGISRVNRKIHSRRGTRMHWVGAFSPQTVGGRRAHPPKATKILTQKINTKENRKAIRSAIAATVNTTIVKERGHFVPSEYPFIISSSFEQIVKTKEIEQVLRGLGFEKELERGKYKKVRPGKGKLRGRPYQRKKSILIVTGTVTAPLSKAAVNIPGVDVVAVNSLNAEILAPGAKPGRVTLWTENAVQELEQKKMFI